ncbi:hypothetical protein [Spiroplasma clarkii]|nr:hypothetical protein [Spiroplasma clarkii]
MASYVMGMYDDEFYKPMISGEKTFYDTVGLDGEYKFNQPNVNNAMGYLAGLNKNLNLAKEDSRKALAWGIQDTGPLTNYLLYHNLDGDTPGGNRAQAGGLLPPWTPLIDNWGTNSSGYSFYNSIMQIGKAGPTNPNVAAGDKTLFSLKEKIAKNNLDVNYTPGSTTAKPSVEIGGKQVEFNQAGGEIAQNAQDNNLNGAFALFGSLLGSVSNSASGSLILAELANYFMPVIISNTSTELFMQGVIMTLITNVWKAINLLKTDSSAKALYGADSEILRFANDLTTAPEPLKDALIPSTTDVNTEQVGFEILGKFSSASNGQVVLNENFQNAKNLIEILDLIIKDFENKDSAAQAKVITTLFDSETSTKSVFEKAYKLPITFLRPETWKTIMHDDNNNGAINLIKFAKLAFEFACDPTINEQVTKAKNKYQSKNSFRNLTSGEKQDFIKILGYNGAGFEEKSFLNGFYSAFTDTNIKGNKEFTTMVMSLKKIVDTGMKKAHENVYQYIFDDKYWKKSNFEINTTSNLDLNGKMSFTLNYTGFGDHSSTASTQTKKVDVPDNFNPYQTIWQHQEGELNKDGDKMSAKSWDLIDKTKVSGKVLGVEQNVISPDALVAYDGTGLYENYKPVEFQYNVEWQNISSDVNNPYWVISKIDCFNKEGTQFYNIY